MKKLRTTIAEYSRWKDLEIYVDRMEAHIESDFSHSLENAKALLESIGKEICCVKGVELAANSSINGVLKKAFSSIGYSNENLVNQISRSLANIGEEIGNLRNEISPTSHGKSLEELRERNNRVDLLTREFIIDSSLTIAVFLIRAFEERNNLEVTLTVETPIDELLIYDKDEPFNDFWNDAYGDFIMGEYSYAASEILFNLDYSAYESEYKAFIESIQENEGEI